MKDTARLCLLSLIIPVLLTATACKGNRDAVSLPKVDDKPLLTPLAPQALTLADSSILQFKEMSAKMRVTATMNGRTQSFNAMLRWNKGEKVWMSMSLLGIEGVRAVITNDSIRWIDRINSQYLDKPYSYIASAVSLDIPFEALERMLLGLPAMMDAEGVTLHDNGQYQEVKGAYRNIYQTAAFFSKVNNMLIEYRAEDQAGQRSLLCRYGDYRSVDGKMFAFERYMKFVQKTDMVDMQVRFTEVNLGGNLTFPYEVPLKFKRID